MMVSRPSALHRTVHSSRKLHPISARSYSFILCHLSLVHTPKKVGKEPKTFRRILKSLMLQHGMLISTTNQEKFRENYSPYFQNSIHTWRKSIQTLKKIRGLQFLHILCSSYQLKFWYKSYRSDQASFLEINENLKMWPKFCFLKKELSKWQINQLVTLLS